MTLEEVRNNPTTTNVDKYVKEQLASRMRNRDYIDQDNKLNEILDELVAEGIIGICQDKPDEIYPATRAGSFTK